VAQQQARTNRKGTVVLITAEVAVTTVGVAKEEMKPPRKKERNDFVQAPTRALTYFMDILSTHTKHP
jgi:hypothetical protein